MSASVTRLKTELSGLLSKIPGVYRELFEAEKVPLKHRLAAAQDLMDRLGLSAVKSVVSKNLTATIDGADLLQAQQELLAQQDLVATELVELKKQLEGPHAADQEGQEDQEGHGEAVRQGEGGTGLLREPEEGKDQGHTQER